VGVSESFGRRLRAERERQGISLASIAARSKIAVGYLEGLERNDVSRWPVGIYRRSFIRFYANALGMNADSVVREFLTLFPDPTEPPSASPIEPPAEAGGLRLTLAPETWAPFSGGFLVRPNRRWAAAACDGTTVLAVATALFAISGQFWLPLALCAICYQLGGILILGNTPGVFLFGAPVVPQPQMEPAEESAPRSKRTRWAGLAVEPEVPSGINQERGMQRT
jgi:transcriptional regulator with XRE-family HTH domain